MSSKPKSRNPGPTIATVQPVLHTPRLHLKPATVDDAEAFHMFWDDPEVIWWSHRSSIDQMREFMKHITATSPLGRDDIGWWLLIEIATGKPVGDAVLQAVPRLPLEIEIGWHLARDHWGKGYATESAHRLLEYGFDTLALDVVIADIAFTNKRSVAVAKRLEMTMRPDPIERSGIPHGVWEVRPSLG